MIDETALRHTLEEFDLTEEKIQEIIGQLQSPEVKLHDVQISKGTLDSQVEALRVAAEAQTDWRKKASIYARIISLGLE